MFLLQIHNFSYKCILYDDRSKMIDRPATMNSSRRRHRRLLATVGPGQPPFGGQLTVSRLIILISYHNCCVVAESRRRRRRHRHWLIRGYELFVCRELLFDFCCIIITVF